MNIRTAPPTVVFPGDAPRRHRTTVLLVVLVVLCLAAAAVVIINLTRGNGTTSPKVAGERTGSSPVSAPTTVFDSQAATKTAILEAYQQSFDSFVAVASDPNGSPEDPELKQHKTGNALFGSQVTIATLRKAGQVYRGTVQVHPSVTELSGDTATVVDCGLDTVSVVDAATGRVVTPSGPSDVGSAGTATFRLINGVWMEDTFKDEKRPCALPAS